MNPHTVSATKSAMERWLPVTILTYVFIVHILYLLFSFAFVSIKDFWRDLQGEGINFAIGAELRGCVSSVVCSFHKIFFLDKWCLGGALGFSMDNISSMRIA